MPTCEEDGAFFEEGRGLADNLASGTPFTSLILARGQLEEAASEETFDEEEEREEAEEAERTKVAHVRRSAPLGAAMLSAMRAWATSSR